MYLKECLLENVGPIEFADISLPFKEDGTPKPIVLVGRNGSGKSILLSHIVDALVEYAKVAYQDVVSGQQVGHSPYFKLTSPSNQRTGTDFGIALLEFSDGSSDFGYVDKSGSLDSESYTEKMRGRFSSVASWPIEDNHKNAPMSEEQSKTLFRGNSVCYFPSSRHERPHWLNRGSIQDDPIFYSAENLANKLYKPIIVESAAQNNKQWLLGVILDSRAEVQLALAGEPPQVVFQLLSHDEDLRLMQVSRANIELLLRNILQDDSARLTTQFRTISPFRIGVQIGDGHIPSLDHLSSGQANLFNLFSTVIRYADRADINKSHQLHEIEGIVLVDEIEAQAHSDLQYEVLPQLIRLFPKVQFILTSHSPLFLLGMESEFGTDGFDVLEMPMGQRITTERFSEFKVSWEYYRQTKAYEEALGKELTDISKPMVFLEGTLDVKYVKTALNLLGREDLLESLHIQWVGDVENGNEFHTGKSALDATLKMVKANPSFSSRRLLLIYDNDTNKLPMDLEKVSVRTMPPSKNKRVTEGIESLVPDHLFDDSFYTNIKLKSTGGKVVDLDKPRFCKYICEVREEVDDFENFQEVIKILEEFRDSA